MELLFVDVNDSITAKEVKTEFYNKNKGNKFKRQDVQCNSH